jgi:hypothetical protein
MDSFEVVVPLLLPGPQPLDEEHVRALVSSAFRPSSEKPNAQVKKGDCGERRVSIHRERLRYRCAGTTAFSVALCPFDARSYGVQQLRRHAS